MSLFTSLLNRFRVIRAALRGFGSAFVLAALVWAAALMAGLFLLPITTSLPALLAGAMTLHGDALGALMGMGTPAAFVITLVLVGSSFVCSFPILAELCDSLEAISKADGPEENSLGGRGGPGILEQWFKAATEALVTRCPRAKYVVTQLTLVIIWICRASEGLLSSLVVLLLFLVSMAAFGYLLVGGDTFQGAGSAFVSVFTLVAGEADFAASANPNPLSSAFLFVVLVVGHLVVFSLFFLSGFGLFEEEEEEEEEEEAPVEAQIDAPPSPPPSPPTSPRGDKPSPEPLFLTWQSGRYVYADQTAAAGAGTALADDDDDDAGALSIVKPTIMPLIWLLKALPHTVLSAPPAMAGTILLLLIVTLVYALVGMAFFGGALGTCVDPLLTHQDSVSLDRKACIALPTYNLTGRKSADGTPLTALADLHPDAHPSGATSMRSRSGCRPTPETLTTFSPPSWPSSRPHPSMAGPTCSAQRSTQRRRRASVGTCRRSSSARICSSAASSSPSPLAS